MARTGASFWASEWSCWGWAASWSSLWPRSVTAERSLVLALWALALALSLILTPHPLVTLARNAWAPWLLAAALVLPCLRLSRSTVTWYATAFVLLLAGDVAVQWMKGTDLFGFTPFASRLRGFLPHPNDTALLAVLVPFTASWACPLALGVILLSGSRNALLGLLVALFVLAAPRWRLALTCAVLVGVLLVTSFAGVAPFTRGIERLGTWLVAIDMGRDAPWLGQGPASYIDHYLPRLDRIRPLPFGWHAEIAFMPWAHDLYLEQFAERGLLGLGAFLLAAGFVLRRGSRAVQAAMIAFLVMGVCDLTFLKPWVTGAFLGLIALTQGDA